MCKYYYFGKIDEIISRSSSAGTATGTDWTAGVPFPIGGKSYSLLHSVQT
jgi:hypothetical protein